MEISRNILSALLLICCLLVNGSDTEDLAGSIVFVIPTILDEIEMDGRLSEPCWSGACTIPVCYHAGRPRPVKADARVLAFYNGESLIFGFDLPALGGDTEPKKCFLSDEYDLRRVPNVTIALDPEHRHGVYYQFVMDAEGHKQDLRVDDESWATEWDVVALPGEKRFSAEVRIPISKISSESPAGRFWGFNVSFSEAAGQENCHSTPMGLKTSDAANFGHLLFEDTYSDVQIGELRQSLPAIHQSMLDDKLTANRALCGPEPEAFPGEIKELKPGGEFRLQDGTHITCLGLDNPPVIRSNFPFFYERFDNPDLNQLRNQYNLQEVIAPGKNDFEQILLLNEWLVDHVPFGSPPPIMPQALHVLQYGLNGQTFYCTFLSFTLMQMYCSLGFTARKITTVGHGTLDVWSNNWRKWMQIDPSRNSYFRLRGTAVPLNSNEIRREFHRNGGVDMEMVFGTEQRAEKVTMERRDRDGAYRYRQEGYEWVAYKTRNNFFEVPFTWWNFDYLIIEDEYNENREWQYRGQRDVRDRIGTRTHRVDDVFWTLNQAYIHLYDEGSPALKAQLETHTPNFDRFEVSLDEGGWHATEAVFYWELHPGQNHLRARSVNKFGVTGPEHKVVLNVDE